MPNLLYYGDNLDILRRYVADESVDLIYLDPPFNSQSNYNVLFAEAPGKGSAAQIRAFEDTWHWDESAELTYVQMVEQGPLKIAQVLQALRTFLGENDMLAYLVMMAPRLVELRRVLRKTGSIYLHCDPTASHYLKLIMDAILGPTNFRNEIVWKRTSAHSSAKRYGPVHDVILMYTKSDRFTWRPQYVPYDEKYLSDHYNSRDNNGRAFTLSDLTAAGTRNGSSGQPWMGFDPSAKGNHWKFRREALDRLNDEGRIYWPASGGWPRYIRYLDEQKGIPLQDVWTDIPPLNAKAAERLGYPTQKPEALLARILQASSNEGDVVLDPFCGCGTAIAAAEHLKRQWIGIDITHLAIALIRRRLIDTYGIDVSSYQVIGEPTDVAGASALAIQDRFQFQWWALGLLGARPAEQDERRGKDKGIDGVLYFFDDRSGQPKKVVLQVKSGHVGSRDVRDLVGVVDREKAAIGALVSLKHPTRDMMTEAVSGGFYEWAPMGGEPKRYLRIQLISIEELLAGHRLKMPPRLEATFKQAARKHIAAAQQMELDLTMAK